MLVHPVEQVEEHAEDQYHFADPEGQSQKMIDDLWDGNFNNFLHGPAHQMHEEQHDGKGDGKGYGAGQGDLEPVL